MRFPELGMPIKWEEEGSGYRLSVQPMIHGSAPPLVIPDCTVGAIRLDCLDGGTVGVDFRMQTTGSPDVETIAELARYVQRNVTIELRPPAAPPETNEAFPEPESLPEDAPF